MKAISIKNPYATQILRGTKTIEYRTWDTKYRGDLLICSSANPKIPGMLSGYALCIANLINITYNSKESIYEWHLEDIRKIKAFPVKGKLNLFDVDDSFIHLSNEIVSESPKEISSANMPVQMIIPQIPGMPKMIDNITARVRDDLEEIISKKSKLRIAAACFSAGADHSTAPQNFCRLSFAAATGTARDYGDR